ncbi:MAG: 3-alpha domain-containing protein, partial [Burkholderiales bacterium]
MTVAQANARLYLPGQRRAALERALAIPALSAGWRGSFRAMLEQKPGLAPPEAPLAPPAWPGFRRLRVRAKSHESADVLSLELEPAEAQSLAAPLPGQFVVLRLQPGPAAPPLLRSYSLSGAPDAAQYRLGIKLESAGAAGKYLAQQVGIGDLLEVSAPRGSFTLEPGTRPVVLASAGIGVTPVLAILHALAAACSTREVWWLYGARDGQHHPFGTESRALMRKLKHGRSRVWYSKAAPEDRLGADFDAHGHVGVTHFDQLDVPRDAEFYLCGPASFMRVLTADLAAWGVEPARVHTEVFGAGESRMPGIVHAERRSPHAPVGPMGTGPLVSFARSNLSARWDPKYSSLLELAEACDVPARWSCRTGVCHR